MNSNQDLNRDSNPDSTPGEPDNFPNAAPSGETSTQRLSNWYESAVQPVTDKTAVSYRRNYFMLVDRAAAALNLDPDFVSVPDLIDQLRADTTLTDGTKATYRAAIMWALKQPDIDFLPSVRESGLELIRAFNPRKGAAQEIKRNARVKARAIAEQDLGPLLNGLLAARGSPQSWGTKTTAWLNAGIATGARPGEWETAYWFDRDRRILRLPNSKLKKQAVFDWQHIPERLLNRADADLASMAEADLENVSVVITAARRQSEALARNLAFFDHAEAQTDTTNEAAIDSLRRLRAWELRNAGLAWRDIEVPARWVGAVDAHLTNVQQYLAAAYDDRSFERFFDGCRAALRKACLRAFKDGRLYSLYDTRSTAAAMVMGHYKKRKRTLSENYAGSDRAFRRAGRFAPSPADTQNQRDQAADRAAEQSAPADTPGSGEAPPPSATDAPAE